MARIAGYILVRNNSGITSLDRFGRLESVGTRSLFNGQYAVVVAGALSSLVSIGPMSLTCFIAGNPRLNALDSLIKPFVSSSNRILVASNPQLCMRLGSAWAARSSSYLEYSIDNVSGHVHARIEISSLADHNRRHCSARHRHGLASGSPWVTCAPPTVLLAAWAARAGQSHRMPIWHTTSPAPAASFLETSSSQIYHPSAMRSSTRRLAASQRSAAT